MSTTGKAAIHRHVVDSGGEGSVWKRFEQPYEVGKRVRHWLKRKATVTVEAVPLNGPAGTRGRDEMRFRCRERPNHFPTHRAQHSFRFIRDSECRPEKSRRERRERVRLSRW